MSLLTLVFLLLIVFVLSNAQTEGFAEMFGFAGHKSVSPEHFTIDDKLENLDVYKQVNLKMDQYHFQEIVFACNKYAADKLGDCTYIIETSDIKQYEHSSNRKNIIRVMFMLVRNSGFVYGFAVTFDVEYETNKVIGARTQPMGIDVPDDVGAYTTDGIGQEFINYELIKEKGQLTKGELDSVKNKFA